MHTLIKFFSATVLVSLLSGCVVHIGGESSDDQWEKTKKLQMRNQDFINQLQTGLSSSSVRTGLGNPDFVEYLQKDGESIEVLFYRTHRTKGDGLTTKDECTALVFRQGTLIGWGEKAYLSL